VKSNLGHTQAAAGVVGVIKMVMAMDRGVLPATLYVEEPSSHVDWTSGRVELLTQAQPWNVQDRPLRAGVSSFGISGTNAHVILEQPPPALPAQADSGGVSPGVLVLSGGTMDGLRGQAERVGAVVQDEVDLADLGWSLWSSRAALGCRGVVIAADRDGAAMGLTALADGDRAPGVVSGRVVAGGVGFVFSGQGAQRPGMARGLYVSFPVFAEAFDEVCALLDAELLDVEAGDGGYGGRSLQSVVFGDEAAGGDDGSPGLLDQTVFAQTGLFAVEVAVVRLLGSLGVTPSVVVGHSVGEIVAAHTAGVLSLEDACRLVAARARLMQALPVGGAMAALDASVAEAHELIAAGDEVGLAAVNGATAVVLAGERGAVEDVVGRWRGRVKWLRVSHGFHSPLVEPMLGDLDEVAASIEHREPKLRWVSTLTGRPVEGVIEPGYWVDQARSTVRFADAAEAMDVATIIEVGPDGQLAALAERDGVRAVGVLRPGHDDRQSFLTAVAEAWVRGASVDWGPLFPGAKRVDLPTYAFQRERYWPEPPPADPGESRLWEALEALDGATPLADVLPRLASRRRYAQIAGWRYRVEWKPLPPLPETAQLSGTWMVVSTSGVPDDVVSWCTQALTDHGATVVPTTEGSPVNGSSGGGRVEGVLLLVGMDEGVGLGATLAELQGDRGAPVWCVTRGAVSVDEGDAAPRSEQAAVWGLGRVAGLEEPERWGGLVDLPPDLDAAAAEAFCHLLSERGGEDQVAIRAGGTNGRRLARAAEPHQAVSQGEAWKTQGTALVTGGTGALGAHVAKWLATAGAEHILLASRRGPDAPGAPALVEEVEALGVAVTVARCDVADREAVAELLRGIPSDRPLRTIVHAAGASVEGELADTTAADLAEASAAKVAGAQHLHELTSATDLDAFVLFSSGAAAWGGRGQGAYAAANSAVDALAEQRRRQGRPATSIAWGPWAGRGMAEGEAGEQLRRRGVREMPAELAVASLQQALDYDEGCLVIADVDWPRFAPAFAAARRRPLIEDIPEVADALDQAPAEETELVHRLAGLSEADARKVLDDVVRAEVAAVLGYAGPTAVEPDRAFKDLGFDSVTAVELRNGLNAATGLRLPATLVFDHPTPRAVARALAAELAPAEADAVSEALGHLAQVESALPGLRADGEAVAHLRARLGRVLSKLNGEVPDASQVEEHLHAADDDELLAFIDRELGKGPLP
jgi:acyl transferase domain-containing protein